MLKGIFLVEEELDNVNDLIEKLKVEIGCNITYPDNKDMCLANMVRAGNYLRQLSNLFEY